MSWYAESLRLVSEQLFDNGNPSTAAMLGCGLEQLRFAVQNFTPSTVEPSCQRLQVLISLAHDKMAATSLLGWRRLHTDASILKSLYGLASSTALQSISTLDRTIIISGPAGEDRLELILNIIQKIQAVYLPIRAYKITSMASTLPFRRAKAPLQSAASKIRCLLEAPSFTAFQTELSRSPFIIPGYARDWPAMCEHPWCSAEYLRSVAGPGRIVPVEVGKDYRADDWTQRLMSWDDFLSSLSIANHAPSETIDDALYLAQHNLFTQFPALREDVLVPDYVYATISSPNFPGYHPPGNDEQLVMNAWLGPKGTTSPAHTDPHHNFYVQVVGRKTVWLAPPTFSPHMYPFPSSASARNPAAASTIDSAMSNTSRVDVFSTEADAISHPEFWRHVVPNAISETLEPGDLLFFPAGWWHAMQSEETSFSVSMWF